MQTFTRLNKLGLCLSHSRSIELIKELGSDHNRQVLEWKQKLENVTDNDCQVADVSMGESPQSIPSQESSEPSSQFTFSSIDKTSSSSKFSLYSDCQIKLSPGFNYLGHGLLLHLSSPDPMTKKKA